MKRVTRLQMYYRINPVNGLDLSFGDYYTLILMIEPQTDYNLEKAP